MNIGTSCALSGPSIISHCDVLDGIGEQLLVDRRGALDDLFDIDALLVSGRNHNDVLNRFRLTLSGRRAAKDIGLRKNLPLGA